MIILGVEFQELRCQSPQFLKGHVLVFFFGILFFFFFTFFFIVVQVQLSPFSLHHLENLIFTFDSHARVIFNLILRNQWGIFPSTYVCKSLSLKLVQDVGKSDCEPSFC